MKIFDAHVHIIDHNYPVKENQGFLPDEFLFSQYEDSIKSTHGERSDTIRVIGGAVVSGSFQGDDQTYLEALLPQLGDKWVGVTQLPESVSDKKIHQLDDIGVKALRFNLARGPFDDLDVLLNQARRVYDLVGWHAEVYVSSKELPQIGGKLKTLPLVSIDHLGLVEDGLPILLDLVENGVKIKATGFGRIKFDIPNVLNQIYDVDPFALMFGTDLPGTRAPRIYELADFELIVQAIGHKHGEEALKNIFYKNALRWYRINDLSKI